MSESAVVPHRGSRWRLAAVLLLGVLLHLGAPVRAHGTSYRDLGGHTLCIDDDSVRVDIDSAAAPDATGYAAEVERTIRIELRSILERYGIPFRTRASCRTLAVRVAFLLRRSEDARGEWFHWLEAAVQVGRAARRDPAADGLLDDIRFDALFTDIRFPPGEGEAFFAAQPAYAAELIEDLALAWWDDLERRPATPRWLPYAGGTLALLAAVAALLLSRRHRAKRS